MGKSVQIKEELFFQLLYYFENPEAMKGCEEIIYKELSEKADKIINHELFTLYKRAPSEREREIYRKGYLKQRGILRSYRTEREIPKEEL